MSGRKWTPGPWLADGASVYEERDDFSVICNLWSSSLPQWEANARLIAAAPDLLDALERCLNFIANTESEMGVTLECGDKARAAIAKAKGKDDD